MIQTRTDTSTKPKLLSRTFSRLNSLESKPLFTKTYLAVCLAVLLASTIFWSYLGAKIHAGNADQVVNSYLFESNDTFQNAVLPGAHTFFIKWPLFLLIRLFGFSSNAFVIATIGTVTATVALFVSIIYRIERRPLVFGTLCLALASVLMLVPSQPYAGGLLPVNMAMITTRNLEYALFVGCLALFVRYPKPKSWQFMTAFGLMGLLIASDKLFLTLCLGGALVALIVYSVTRGWNLLNLSARWLLGGIGALAVSTFVLRVLDASGLTNISSQSGLGPYGLVHTAREVLLADLYAIISLFTNFGANPASDTISLRAMPARAISNLLSVSGPAYIINALILGIGLLVVLRLIKTSLASNRDKKIKLDNASRLSLLLIWATFAGFGAFTVSKHYYPVDARYLTIALFSVFISAAAYSRHRVWLPRKTIMAGLILMVSVGLGVSGALRTHRAETVALSNVNERNKVVNQALAHHPVKALVGDYWRVVPTKFSSPTKLNIAPLANCTQNRDTLTSKTWQTDLGKNSFAYLLSLDKSLTDYPSCQLDQVVKNYGAPNASAVIAGTLSEPKELLLFYDKGIQKASSATGTTPAQASAAVVPITLDELPYTSCPVPTVMNIVAHEDDDLLFMNPDLLRSIKAGHCIRTVFMTAGDAGSDKFYWLNREQGAQAAYSQMLGHKDIWISRIVKISDHQFITIAQPKGNTKVSLIFMHLPDGNMKGQGFQGSDYENLARLESGQIGLLHSVDKESAYNSNELSETLTSLMHTYRPTEIRTQSTEEGDALHDHSDHMAVSRYTQRAYRLYEERQFEGRLTIPIKFYLGYPVRQRPENVIGKELEEKEAAFFAYSQFDTAVCDTREECYQGSAYEYYLKRQYQNDH